MTEPHTSYDQVLGEDARPEARDDEAGMTRNEAGAVAGLGEVIVVWGMVGLDALAIYRWYSAASPGSGQPVSADPAGGRVDRDRGLEHLLGFVRHPGLPVAIATAPIVWGRLPSRDRTPVLSVALLVGGVVGSAVGRPGRGVAPMGRVDAVAAAGVVGSLTMTLGAVWRGVNGPIWPCLAGGGSRGGVRARLMLGAGLVLNGLPWILADAGVYVGDVPLLGRLFLSRQVPPGGRGPAVHLGHHHGLDGTLLALVALALARRLPNIRPYPAQQALSAYLAMLLVYGTMRAVEDGWHEQVVKRGSASWRIPPVVARRRPVRPVMWAGMVGVAAVAHRGWMRGGPTSPPRPIDAKEWDGRTGENASPLAPAPRPG